MQDTSILKECASIEDAYEQANLFETYSNDKQEIVTTSYYGADNTSSTNTATQSPNVNFQKNYPHTTRTQNKFLPQQYSNNNQETFNKFQRNRNNSVNFNVPNTPTNIKNENANDICCICNKQGHIGENCRSKLQCTTCNIKGHTADVCRQHLTCSKCNRKGHLSEQCYAKSIATSSYMSFSDDDLNIIKWKAKINGLEVIVALDNGASKSVMSWELAKNWNVPINKSYSKIETSSGEQVNAIGQTNYLKVEFESIQANVSFLITNIKAVDVLLGVDWFKQTGVLLDPKKNAFILPQRQISTKEVSSYNEENDLAYTLNMLCIENDEMEFIDDYTCFDTNILDLSKMTPKSQITKETLDKFNELLQENKNNFAISADQLGCCKGGTFNIETTSDQPIHSVPYRQPPAITKRMEEEVKSLEKAGIIRKGSAGTSSSPAFIIKQNGKDRMVINFKLLNAITKQFKFPLPRIDDQLDSFQGTKYYSTIDLRKGFYQLELSEESKHKAGFTTPFGIFEFNRLPFGLSNGPAFFSSVMQNILGDLPFIRVYIDDITIASKNEFEHLEHIKILLNRLNEHNLKINPDKCNWFATEIKLLGHIVDQNGIRMDMAKIEAIVDRKAPFNVKNLQSFLGATNYYRKFIQNYSNITAPLHKLTSAQNKWQWSKECQEAFVTLKQKLVEYPILRAPDFTRPFIVHTDASHLALGATLAQIDDSGKEYACYFASKLLKDSERVYGIAELECLAIVWALNTFRVYFYTERFTIYTDNAALKWLLTLNNPSGRLTRWSIMLSQFNFEIKHRPGKSHSNADALSRPVLLSL